MGMAPPLLLGRAGGFMGEQGQASRKQSENRGSVLVVDDSRLVRTVVGNHLKAAGFNVNEADNGQTAMHILSKGSYDVIITDLNMPELDGFAVLPPVKPPRLSLHLILLPGP